MGNLSLSRSIHSPAFRASLDAFLASPAGKDKALCFRCHAPHVREFLDQVQLFIDQAKAGDPVAGWGGLRAMPL